jgi:hypothetical protein
MSLSSLQRFTAKRGESFKHSTACQLPVSLYVIEILIIILIDTKRKLKYENASANI